MSAKSKTKRHFLHNEDVKNAIFKQAKARYDYFCRKKENDTKKRITDFSQFRLFAKNYLQKKKKLV